MTRLAAMLGAATPFGLAALADARLAAVTRPAAVLRLAAVPRFTAVARLAASLRPAAVASGFALVGAALARFLAFLRLDASAFAIAAAATAAASSSVKNANKKTSRETNSMRKAYRTLTRPPQTSRTRQPPNKSE